MRKDESSAGCVKSSPGDGWGKASSSSGGGQSNPCSDVKKVLSLTVGGLHHLSSHLHLEEETMTAVVIQREKIHAAVSVDMSMILNPEKTMMYL